jgi:CBS domain-containing protein
MTEPRVNGSISRARLVSRVTPVMTPVRPTAPALEVMTDLAKEAPHIVEPDRPIDDALHDMIGFGVRLLLVVRDGDVVGLITSYDIMGERPIQFLQDPFASGKPHRHSDIKVADIMTSISDAHPLRLSWVAVATVGEVATLFKNCLETHLLVVDEEPRGGAVVRGIFSRTTLERQLGPLIR